MDNAKRIRIEQVSLRKRILKLIDHCEICGDTTKEILQVHHIIPVKVGGTNSANNLIVLCPNCHCKAHRGLISYQELLDSSNSDNIKKAIESKKTKNSSKIEIKLKSVLALKGHTLTSLVTKLKEKQILTSVQNISNKLKRGSINYLEMVDILDSIGYDIEWQERK